jgi:hypothetical protein
MALSDFTPFSMDDITNGIERTGVDASRISEGIAAAYKSTSGSGGAKDPGLSDADKRLFVVSSRAARALYNNGSKTDTYTSDRGPITSMKLLAGPGFDDAAILKSTEGRVAEDINALKAGRFVNFFVTDINLGLNEKTQITQTFGDNEVVYYFGRQPLMMNISGLLFDSLENDWFYKFLSLYAGVLRGTQLAKTFSLVELTLPNMIVTGTIAGLNVAQNSQRDTDIPFQMQFIAKHVVPLPAIMPSGTVSNNVGNLVDFKATRAGVQGYTLSSGGLGGGFTDGVVKSIGNVTSGMGGYAGAIMGQVNNVSSTLNSFRTNIFTPVFGIISSITKIVHSTTGTITSIISSFTNPVNQVLRDIASIATQAAGLALLVENSVNTAIQIPSRTATNARNTIRSLKNAAGTISRVPENISETFKRLYGSGRVKRGAAVLSSGKARKKSKAAVLSSGVPYSPSTSNRL